MTEFDLAIIKKALIDTEKLEIKSLESFPSVKANHSKEYICKINNLIEKERKRENSVFHWTAKRKLAFFIVAILLISLTITACAFTKPIKDFFIEVYPQFTRFSADKDTPSPPPQQFKRYEPTWIPSEYYCINRDNTNGSSIIVWSNGAHKIFLQQSFSAGNTISIDTEGTAYKKELIDNLTVYYVHKNNTYSIVWTFEEYNFSLSCHDSISWENVIKTIKSLTS